METRAAKNITLMSEPEFVDALKKSAGVPVHVTLTCNRSSLISVRRGAGGIKEARVQHAFRAADQAMLGALGRFIRKPDQSSRDMVDAFISARQDLVRFFSKSRRQRRRIIVTKGRHKDLTRIMEKVIGDYNLAINGIKITWSRPGPGPNRRASIRFGSYSHDLGLVRIHPDLDKPGVPDFFVEFVVYHELLHALFPPARIGNGKRTIHGQAFKTRERRFKEYEKAIAFQKEFIRTRLNAV